MDIWMMEEPGVESSAQHAPGKSEAPHVVELRRECRDAVKVALELLIENAGRQAAHRG